MRWGRSEGGWVRPHSRVRGNKERARGRRREKREKKRGLGSVQEKERKGGWGLGSRMVVAVWSIVWRLTKIQNFDLF